MIDEITTKRLGTTVVMDHNNIVGIVTDGDIRRMLKNKTSITGLSAQDIMSPSPILIKENMLATKAMSLLEANAISHLVVVDQSGNYQGILHILDIIKEGISA